MSLATRCTQCGTIFRVVQDQLKVSEGWVRCGRCQEVFSALEGLFDLEREAPPRRPASSLTATQVARQGMVEFVASHSPTPTDKPGAVLAETHEDDAIESRMFAPESLAAYKSVQEATLEDDPDFVDARFPSEFADDAALDADGDYGAARHVAPEPPAPAPKRLSWRERRAQRRADEISSMLSGLGVHDDESARPAVPDRSVAPDFLRQAERAAQWQRPRVRASLIVAGAMLLGVLAVQVAVQFRDTLAARWARARPPLEALCDVMGCRIEPPRRLAALTVEASGLTQVDGGDTYRLSLSLHNRASIALAMPSVDLRLTDTGGSLIARRALAPADFRGTPEGAATTSALAAGAEAQLHALLAARGARIGGYTIELFYP